MDGREGGGLKKSRGSLDKEALKFQGGERRILGSRPKGIPPREGRGSADSEEGRSVT